MHSEVSEISPVLVEVKIEIPWADVQKDLDSSFRKVGKTARIKGFRPGKVPHKVVRQLFGRQVKGEVTAQLIEKGLLHAVTEHELQIVAQPEVDAPIIKDGEPLAFSAKIEVRPKIEAVDLSRMVIHQPKAEIEAEQIDQEVERLRREHAQIRAPEPMRPSRAGDRLVIQYTVEVDGEIKPDMGAQDRPVELGADKLIPEFEQGLVGLSPGDERDIDVAFDEDYEQDEIKGKTATFHVKVDALQEMLLPEVDDELAKDCGDFETLLELRLDLRKNLERMASDRADAELKEKLVDKLVETNDVPVPPSMVHEEAHRMMYEFAQIMRLTGQTPKLGDELHATMHERAERKVKAAILLGALAREQSIDIGPSEIDERIQAIAEETGKHVAKVRAEYQGERLGQLENQILEEKLMTYLKGKATISEEPEPVAEAKDAPANEKKPTKKKAAKSAATKKPKASAAKKATKKKATNKPTKKKKAEDDE